jgi:hypothetical protein
MRKHSAHNGSAGTRQEPLVATPRPARRLAAKTDPPTAGPPDHSIGVEMGAMRNFGSNDIADRPFDDGWSPSEDWHNWNDGRDAKLDVWIGRTPSAPSTLSIAGTPYLAGRCQEQEITLYANGYRMAHWHLLETQLTTLACVIEPEQWLRRAGGGLLHLVWHIPGSTRPVEMSHTDDHRRLGFCFRTIMLGQNAG